MTSEFPTGEKVAGSPWFNGQAGYVTWTVGVDNPNAHGLFVSHMRYRLDSYVFGSLH